MAPKSAFSDSQGPFPTLEAANAARPSGNKRRLFVVTGPDGKAHYTWADGSGSALIHVARGLGYRAARHDQAPTRERVAGMLGQLSREDQAILFAQFAALIPPAPAPAPTNGPVAAAADKATDKAPVPDRAPGRKGGGK
jgi:hypothetical protein